MQQGMGMSIEAFDTGVPHSARVYDYLLGGKENFRADREAAERALEQLPSLRTTALANRGFMVRAARHLASEHGLAQFLDIGTGLPTSPNLHQVVQAVDPRARVVYVDNDPLVLAHAQALLTGTPEGKTSYLEADLRDAGSVLADPRVSETLDLTRPVVVSLIGILHFITDDEAALRIVSTLMEPLVSGSALMLSMVTTDAAPDKAPHGFESLRANVTDAKPRTREEVETFFRGLQLLEPGVIPVHRWHPDPADSDTADSDTADSRTADSRAADAEAADENVPEVADETVHMHCGVALKA